jgi:hypothetical protein
MSAGVVIAGPGSKEGTQVSAVSMTRLTCIVTKCEAYKVAWTRAQRPDSCPSISALNLLFLELPICAPLRSRSYSPPCSEVQWPVAMESKPSVSTPHSLSFLGHRWARRSSTTTVSLTEALHPAIDD